MTATNVRKQSHTGYNKEHIALSRERTTPIELTTPDSRKIWNCQLEQEKIQVNYACGLRDTMNRHHRWNASPKNRKLCPQCKLRAAERRGTPPEDTDLGGGYAVPDRWNWNT